MIRISRNTDLIIIHDFILDVDIIIGTGNSSAISTSKIINITAIKKNRDKNGRRAEFLGSKPHSNGDLFSRSSLIFFEISVASNMMADDNRIVIVDAAIIIIIYLVFHKFRDWKSSILSLVLDKYYFIFLISRSRCRGIIKLRLRNVSIMLLLRTQNDDLMRSVVLCVADGMCLGVLFQ